MGTQTTTNEIGNSFLQDRVIMRWFLGLAHFGLAVKLEKRVVVKQGARETLHRSTMINHRRFRRRRGTSWQKQKKTRFQLRKNR